MYVIIYTRIDRQRCAYIFHTFYTCTQIRFALFILMSLDSSMTIFSSVSLKLFNFIVTLINRRTGSNICWNTYKRDFSSPFFVLFFFRFFFFLIFRSCSPHLRERRKPMQMPLQGFYKFISKISWRLRRRHAVKKKKKREVEIIIYWARTQKNSMAAYTQCNARQSFQ